MPPLWIINPRLLKEVWADGQVGWRRVKTVSSCLPTFDRQLCHICGVFATTQNGESSKCKMDYETLRFLACEFLQLHPRKFLLAIDRVSFSCLFLRWRGLTTGSCLCGDWLLHRVSLSSLMQTALGIQIYRHLIRPPSCRHLAQREQNSASQHDILDREGITQRFWP